MSKAEDTSDALPLREAAAEDSTPSMGLNLVFRSHVT
jgi:hypothetical protein